MPSIFISYRISDSADITGRIYDHLKQRFGAGEVFCDALSIRAGNDYRDDIHQALSVCRVLVVVIGPQWLSAVDAQGNRRLHQPDDWVRREIETALSRDIPILPLLVNNAPHPAAKDLPESLVPLTYRQSLPIRTALDFQADMSRLIERLGELVPATRAIVAVPHNLPRSGATAFVGRDTELADLHRHLTQENQLAITALRGMGGIGKTELALQYALHHLYQGTYPGGICWLQAKEQSIGTEIVTFAQVHLKLIPPDELKLPQQVAYIWQHWPTSGDVLVAIDDVSGPDYNAAYAAIKPYLPPQNSRFRMLLTTRLQLGASIQTVQIEVLSEGASLDLLRSLVGAERIDQKLDIAKALCEWLGYLPLGLELVGRFLARKPGWTLAKMQQQLDKKRLAARALCQAQTDMTATHESVAAAFELSWQDLTPAAQELAYRLSLYALAPILWEWLEQCYEGTDPDELEDWLDEELVNRSLATVVSASGAPVELQLHQLIREFFRSKLELWAGAEALKQGYCQAMVQVAQQIPDIPTRDQILAVTAAIPHLVEAATIWQQWLDDESLGWPFIGLERFYEGQGAYGQSEPWCRECLTVTRDRLGDDHPDVATSMNNLAVSYDYQGRYGEAEPLYRDALTLRQRLFGNDHPDVAHSMHNLANLYESQGRYGEAEPLYRDALALRQRLLGDDHPDVATSMHNLAILYESQGRYSEAEPLYRDALALYQRLLGDNHHHVAKSMNNLASLYQSQGRYSEAEPLYRDALMLHQRLLGNEHPHVANNLWNLGALKFKQRRLEEAKLLLLEALHIYEAKLGPAHPNTQNLKKWVAIVRVAKFLGMGK